jgi:hypothetical protein
MTETVTHTGTLWLWSGPDGSGSWHFLTIDGLAADAIRAHEAMRRLELGSGRGFGSVKVAATIGDTRWTTSVFPSGSHEGYLLPVKLAVRKAEDLAAGDEAEVVLGLL